MPAIGEIAPDFTLQRDGGDQVTLSVLRGGPVVLFFYPRDDTSGCTTEAKDFTALLSSFQAEGATVFGISRDSVASHDKFVAKQDLGIPLLADVDGAVTENYGVWVEKSMYGRTYMGIERSTFLIGSDGTIREIWRKVRVKGHAQTVLDATTAL